MGIANIIDNHFIYYSVLLQAYVLHGLMVLAPFAMSIMGSIVADLHIAFEWSLALFPSFRILCLPFSSIILLPINLFIHPIPNSSFGSHDNIFYLPFTLVHT